jgi:1-deoxy-D-xylulose-5-phosphate reductoisomerase
MGYPARLKSNFPRFNFMNYPQFTFEPPDKSTFRCLALAESARLRGGNTPCVLNAANEIAVAAFLKEKIKFTQIPDLIEHVMEKIMFVEKPELSDYVNSNDEARRMAESFAHI